jgi:RNA polymerase sigma factor (sigma-70 family)
MSGTTSDFLNSIARYPLLTPEQEITLGHQIQAWMPLRDKLHPTPEERTTIRMGIRAHRKLYQSNLRLAVHIARKFNPLVANAPGGMDYDDLIQEACVGLARSVEKFDPTRGYRFSTYAYWWVRQGITRALDTASSTIRLPCGWRKDLQNLAAAANDLRCNGSSNFTVKDLASKTGIAVEKVEALLLVGNRISSLDSKPKGAREQQDACSILDLIPSTDTNTLEAVEISADYERIIAALGILDEKTRELVELRYGLNGKPEITLAELGRTLGCSGESIRQIIKRASNEIRFHLGQTTMLQEDLFRSGPVTTTMVQREQVAA